MKELKTALTALGVGVAAAAALIPATGPIAWRIVVVAAVQASLAALGVGVVANRNKA